MPFRIVQAMATVAETIELGEPPEVKEAVAALATAVAAGWRGKEIDVLIRDLERAASATPLDRGQCAVLVQRLQASIADRAALRSTPAPAPPPPPAPAPAAEPEPAAPPAAYRWAVAPDAIDVLRDFAVEGRGLLDEAEQAFLALEGDSEHDGTGVASAFRAFHTIKGVAGFLELDVLAETAHRTESLLAEVRDGVLPAAPCVDIVLAGIDHVRALIDHALRGAPHDLAPLHAFYEALTAAGATAVSAPAPPPEPVLWMTQAVELPTEAELAAEPATVEARPSEPEPAPVPVVAAAAPPPEAPAAEAPARAAPAADPSTKTAARRDEDSGAVKVDISKLDQLLDMVGELAIAQAQLSSDPGLATVTTPSLLRSIASFARVARELQRAALAMRMVAIKSTFDRMGRVARDTARSLGKSINFQIEGGQTELDRTMVEAIYDPLVHLVRNAIDHGVEGPIERARRGKPSAGTLLLRAYHQAGHVVVEIVDDGGGLDRDRILAHARNRGLVGPDETPSADEIHMMIFMPGFSTAAKVTSVSGRGVGMDVVRTNIERVRGRVEIATTPGQGTTIRLKLPLTLAIIDGLLVGVGGERYVLPATWAREIFRPLPEQRISVQGRGEVVKVRGTLYPVERLAARLGRYDDGGDGDGVMIMVDHGRGVCLQVDRLLGKQEVVVKGLGAMFGGTAGVSGGAILGDGKVALILDIPTLLGPPSSADREAA